MRIKQVQGNKAVFADKEQGKKKQWQAKLAALADKRAKRQFELEDVDAKLDVIIEMLQDLMLPK